MIGGLGIDTMWPQKGAESTKFQILEKGGNGILPLFQTLESPR